MGINALNAFPVPTEQTMGGSRSTQALGVAAGGHRALRDWNGHQRAAEALSSAALGLGFDKIQVEKCAREDGCVGTSVCTGQCV